MSKAPWLIANDVAVRDRVRRLPRDMPMRREAKRLLKEENDTRAAMAILLDLGDVTQEHVDAHERWLTAQRQDPEDFA